jgi:hypothetical protein
VKHVKPNATGTHLYPDRRWSTGFRAGFRAAAGSLGGGSKPQRCRWRVVAAKTHLREMAISFTRADG